MDIRNLLRNTLPMDDDEDFVVRVGLPLIAHRLRRASDAVVRDVGMLLAQRGLGIPPRAASVMMLLLEYGDLSVTGAARRLRLSHPMVINLAQTLKQANLVQDVVDRSDSRRRLLRLTAPGRKQAERLSALNDNLSAVFKQMFDEAGIDLFEALEAFETSMERHSLFDRVNVVGEECSKDEVAQNV